MRKYFTFTFSRKIDMKIKCVILHAYNANNENET